MSLTTYDISGMHCASCVGRVERTLLALPDVTLARVNLALEEAIVQGLPDSAAEARVAQAITDSGYKAKIKVAGAGRQEQVERRQSQVRTLGFQTLIAGLLTFPVFVVEMGGHIYPPMHHWVFSIVGQTNSWFAQFLLITLVMIWPGRSFYTLGLPSLFRGAPDMNALVAIGTLAAWGYSVVSLFAPSLLPMGNLAVYFEAAGVIITLILLGRFLEARAKGRTGDAIARLVGLRAKTAMVLRNEQWIEIAADQIQIGDEIQLRPVVLRNLIDDSMEALESFIAKHKAEVELVWEVKRDVQVVCDSARMEQVLDNLIVNAIKYSPVGSSVIVVIREKNNRVYIDVRDHGFGIPDGDLARIFERFYRVDKARARSEGGSGLGLSIVKHIVEAHGEEITVSSKERVGSVFTFSLAKVKR